MKFGCILFAWMKDFDISLSVIFEREHAVSRRADVPSRFSLDQLLSPFIVHLATKSFFPKKPCTFPRLLLM